jgi:hypothetical protein
VLKFGSFVSVPDEVDGAGGFFRGQSQFILFGLKTSVAGIGQHANAVPHFHRVIEKIGFFGVKNCRP